MGETAPLIVTDIHKTFGTLEVLKGISLETRKGDVISLIGSSGSGKSTFLRCINLLEEKPRTVSDLSTFLFNVSRFAIMTHFLYANYSKQVEWDLSYQHNL